VTQLAFQLDLRMVTPLVELSVDKLFEIALFRESVVSRTKASHSGAQVRLFLSPVKTRDFFSLEVGSGILRLESAPFAGFPNALILQAPGRGSTSPES
jgi:hypothetical protein